MGNMRCNDPQWIGFRNNNLTVVGFIYKNNRWLWECKCSACGNKSIIYPNRVVSGKQKSCKCGRSVTFHEMHMKHGEAGTRLYEVWCGMNKRCNNPNTSKYERYGGRGISVCEEWRDYDAFRQWAINNGYSDDLTLDRVDNDGNYCPDNCRWVDRKTQARNRSSNIVVDIDGEKHTLVEWCEKCGLNYSTVYTRIKRGGMDARSAIMK